jgi:hypothetical protein
MKRKWQLFLFAAFLSGAVLMKYGAPPLAVVAGIAGAALVTRKRPIAS